VKNIPVQFLCPVLAMPVNQAAKSLGVSRRTIWRLCASGQLTKTSYGTIPVAELERHLVEQINHAKAA
jgi:hypothetical protein